MSERASKIVATDRPGGVPASAARPTIAFDDLALVERCRKGDMQAFGMLVAKYQDRLLNLVGRVCGRWAEAEDLAQEAFLKALEKLGTFRGQSQFYTWLFRIAANLALSHRRHVERINFRSVNDGDEAVGGQAAGLSAMLAQRRHPSPEAAAMTAETSTRVAAELEDLEEQMRMIIILRDIEDMSYEEIAQVLDVPAGTVKSRLHRARCLLKDKLSDLV
ncbi:MAG: sigma-70 family RNA polymerase sigma factor [Phycisphaerae bacterium]